MKKILLTALTVSFAGLSFAQIPAPSTPASASVAPVAKTSAKSEKGEKKEHLKAKKEAAKETAPAPVNTPAAK